MFRRIGLGVLSLVVAGQLAAQEKTEERPTGLPKKVKWTFNLDAGLGVFGFSNSLYRDVKPDPSGDLSDNWIESYIKPAISGTVARRQERVLRQAELRGRADLRRPAARGGRGGLVVPGRRSLSRLAFRHRARHRARMHSSSPSAGPSTRSATACCCGTAAAKAGPAAASGATRARHGRLPASPRFQPKHHKFECFYLDRDEIPETETGTKRWRRQLRPDAGRGVRRRWARSTSSSRPIRLCSRAATDSASTTCAPSPRRSSRFRAWPSSWSGPRRTTATCGTPPPGTPRAATPSAGAGSPGSPTATPSSRATTPTPTTTRASTR